MQLIKRYLHDGSFVYVDKATDRVVRLRRETTVGMGRLPEYAFRWLKPGKTAMV